MVYKDAKGDYLINAKGAKVYTKIENNAFLEIPDVKNNMTDDGVTHKVLSVGFLEGGFPLATIKENGNVKAYRLPDDLSGWVEMNVSSSHNGVKMFPCKVEFGRLVDENRVYAELV